MPPRCGRRPGAFLMREGGAGETRPVQLANAIMGTRLPSPNAMNGRYRIISEQVLALSAGERERLNEALLIGLQAGATGADETALDEEVQN
jgi:hypothetical protein